MIILEIYRKQPFDIIAMIPKRTLGLCCVHIAKLMTHPAAYTLPLTLQLCYKPLHMLQRLTKSRKVQISSRDILQQVHNIDFDWHSSRGFLRNWVVKQELPPWPIIFLRTIKSLFLEFEGLYVIINGGEGGSWTPHTKTHCGHSCCNKNFQIITTSDLHRLADDVNDNHNYIACLFILLFIL